MNYKRRYWITIALISLLCCIFSGAQAQADSVIVLPVKTVRQMFHDVKERDQLRVELGLKDSTIRVYEFKEGLYKTEIHTLKLNKASYEEIISNLGKLDEVRLSQIADLNKELKQTRGAGAVIITILIALLLL